MCGQFAYRCCDCSWDCRRSLTAYTPRGVLHLAVLAWFLLALIIPFSLLLLGFSFLEISAFNFDMLSAALSWCVYKPFYVPFLLIWFVFGTSLLGPHFYVARHHAFKRPAEHTHTHTYSHILCCINNTGGLSESAVLHSLSVLRPNCLFYNRR